MSAILCTKCGRELDADAPGASCGCHKRPSARAPRPSNLGRVVITAHVLAGPERAVTEADFVLAAAIHRNEVEA